MWKLTGAAFREVASVVTPSEKDRQKVGETVERRHTQRRAVGYTEAFVKAPCGSIHGEGQTGTQGLEVSVDNRIKVIDANFLLELRRRSLL